MGSSTRHNIFVKLYLHTGQVSFHEAVDGEVSRSFLTHNYSLMSTIIRCASLTQLSRTYAV